MNQEERLKFIQHRIEKTKEALEEVSLLYRIEHYSTAASRLYYAAFYAASALLAKEKASLKTHSGVRNELNRIFVKTGILTREQGKLFSRLFDLRQQGDYGEVEDVDQEMLDAVMDKGFKLIEHILILCENPDI